jgi:hypothetical protein
LKERKIKSLHISAETKFNDAIRHGLKNATIKSLSDIKFIYDALIPINYQKQYYYGLLLKKFLIELNSNKGSIKDTVSIADCDNQIKMFIEKIESSPFVGIPEIERSLLSDTLDNLNIGNINTVRNNLQELYKIMRTRAEESNHDKKLNRIAFLIAILSLLLAVREYVR